MGPVTTPQPALKTFTLARARAGVTAAQLAGYWQGVHAANVVRCMAPDRYTLTFFDPRDGRSPYSGMAELGYDDAARGRSVTGANIPAEAAADGWADLVELPTTWLRVAEHVIVAGPEGEPAGRAAREAAFKLTFLIHARDGVDAERVRRHWLEVHVPNFRERFVESGGVRYVVNLAERATGENLVGLAELSYRDRASAEAHQPPEDGFKDLIVLRALPGHEVLVTV